MKVRKVFFLSSLLSLASFVHAQERLTFSYDSILFNQLVVEIESKTSYRFFYDVRMTDSLKVSVSVADKELPAILQQVLSGKDLHFAIDRNRRVFLTEGREIMTDIPDAIL